MDMNLVVVAGKLAAPVELREFESGSRLLRALITVRSTSPRRRVDVLPVVLWDPEDGHDLLECPVGKRVLVVGSVQRRFWSGDEGRQSRLELIAHHIELHSALATANSGSDR